ncbi:MAG: undecaprenyl-diphosphate phosphatase [Proteobacteria bacterium]|nr:undecaprenyl-diphosphate phosphatase [Pseudomonadota bacterium]
METVWIMVLGAIQGATEFLPVSSSGHLAAAQMLIQKNDLSPSFADQPLVLEILLHMATLLAVIVFFWRDVLAAIKGAGSLVASVGRAKFLDLINTDDGANMALGVVMGTVPTAFIGLAMRDPAGFIAQSATGLGVSFLCCACLLFASRSWPGGERRLTWRIALVIGLVQGIAVLPGISRSGATIALALALGLDRVQAVRFSFLLSLPAILGAAVLELNFNELVSNDNNTAYLLGGCAAFVIGLGALFVLNRLVRAGRLWVFAPYVGVVAISTFFFL